MPRAEGLPITKEILTWARERAGMTAAEAAEKYPRFSEWEAGTALPSYPQLEKLADDFKVPVAVFFFPGAPRVPPIKESFRTLPDTEFERLPRQVSFMLRRGKALQLNLSELTQGRNPARRFIMRDLSFPDDVSPDVMALRVREYIGITVEDQIKWSDDDIALKEWRKSIQEVGIYVFKDAFRIDDYFGFSLYDEIFPIIYINNSSTKTRQIFTLFHELAHILFHTSGIDTQRDVYIPNLGDHQKRIEILCNRFASNFLLPEDAFRAAMAGLERSERTAEILAKRFHVSREVIFRRFLDRRWITTGDYAEAAGRWANQRQGGGSSGGGDFYRTKIAYLGREYIGLAFSQYYQNRIDESQLAEYLETKARNVSALEEYYAAGA